MLIAKEGYREIALATLLLGAGAAAAGWFSWLGAVPFVILWLWVLSFFRDPHREGRFEPGELCAPADGTVTEVTELEHYAPLGQPAVRIGVFLSLFDVHVNRAPCSGRVRSVSYSPGAFLDARRGESGRRNESNALLLAPDGPIPGPIEVRQVAGLLARRIVCHAVENQYLPIGARFGLIKFGSRTELVIPRVVGTEVRVGIGNKVRAGLTVVARQPVGEPQTRAAHPVGGMATAARA